MSVLLDYMCTPMAAPETAGLKTMRQLILVSCVLLLIDLAFIQALGFDGIRSQLLASGASPLTASDLVAGLKGGTAALLLCIAGLSPFYVVIKNRADDAHLMTLVGRGDDA